MEVAGNTWSMKYEIWYIIRRPGKNDKQICSQFSFLQKQKIDLRAPMCNLICETWYDDIREVEKCMSTQIVVFYV